VGVLNSYDIMLAHNVPACIATRKRVLKVTLQVATLGAESVTALLDSEMSRGVADMQTDRRSTLGFIQARLNCSCFYIFLPARRYASAGTGHGPVSVCHKSVFFRNGWTDRAGFWHVGFFRLILHCVLRKFRYLQKRVASSGTLSQTPDLLKISPRHVDRRNVLPTSLEKGGRSQRDKLDRRRSS